MSERPNKPLEIERAVAAPGVLVRLAESPPVLLWLLVGAVAALFLALVGALDSYRYGLVFRLAFWSAICLTGGALGAGLEALLNRVAWGGNRSYLKWLVLIGTFALVMTPVAYLANSLGGVRPLTELWMYLQNAIVISSAYVGLRLLLGGLQGAAGLPDEAAPAQSPAFMARLPVRLRQGTLRALCAEGHYVRAWTDQGSDLVLFRLKDAVRELAGIEGMQVHRSWWVARAAIIGSRRDKGRLWLVLEGDIRAPVSRPNVSRLRDAGWL
ncbi:MAG: LytTR family DNA-binding domain-containing protein [Pseudomonadota bacterium]